MVLSVFYHVLILWVSSFLFQYFSPRLCRFFFLSFGGMLGSSKEPGNLNPL